MKQGWERKALGEIAKFHRGLTYSKGDEVETSSKMVLRSNNVDLDTNSLVLEDLKCLREDFVIDDDKKVKPNTILICMSNGSKQHIGKVAYIQDDVDFAFGGFMGLIAPANNISGKYIFYTCISSHFKHFLAGIGNGIGITNLRFADLSSFSLPVPPIAEQEKIVAELDCLSGIIEKKKQQLKELDALAQSIFYEMFGNSSESIPVSYYITGLTAGKSLAGDEECSNKVLKTGAVTYDYFDGKQVKNLPLEYVPALSHKVNINDLLISRMNTAELVGACAYVWRVDDSTYLPDRLWRAEINELSHPVYLWKALTTDKAKEQIRNYASGTSGSMKNISKSSFLSVQIPKATLIKQQVFASKIEAIEKQKELIKQSIQETETLFNSRMDYYFN